jgi:hypothetical protein
MAESMRVDFITLHGRTANAKPNSAVDFDAVIASSNPFPENRPQESKFFSCLFYMYMYMYMYI